MQEIIEKIKKSEPEFVALRRKIHQHPEVGFEEQATSALVAEKLKEWGYEVNTGLAKTGVVGTLKLGTGKKILGIRADIDALPMVENSGKEWCSTVQGRFHGCGHDGHTAILLCAAKYIAEAKNFNGTLHLIFQPGEELLYGGRVMMDDGLFKKFPCDAIFAMHNLPGFKKGVFYFKEGATMASSDTIHINIKGVGGHGAMPEFTVDAGVVACQIVVALQTIVSRNVPPVEPAVVTVGCIQSGEAPNIINEKAVLKLSVRAMSKAIREKLLERIADIAKLQAESFGATVTIEHVNGSPVLMNDKKMTDFAESVAKDMFGEERVSRDVPPILGSEDFAFMLEENPNGCYMIIGAGDSKDDYSVHNPRYDFNDSLIVPAAAYWAGIAESYLK